MLKGLSVIERVVAEIDLAALQHNFQIVKSYAPQQKILAMVKANAYGHGLIPIADALKKVDAFGVACLEEALILRSNGIKQDIVIMSGINSAAELMTVAKEQLQIVLHHESQLKILLRTKLPAPVTAWIKINTGMNRLGFSGKDIADIHQLLNQCDSIKKPLNWMTHFADADDKNKTTTPQQIKSFLHYTENYSGPKSLANSAGIIAWPSAHADWVRPGIMLYGVSPLLNTVGSDFDLQPVMTLKAKLIAINTVEKNAAIGYGGVWQAPETMPVGVVAIGYGDGYPRHAVSGTPVLINNVQCPLVGRVSMDMITVDLRSCPHANVGDEAILWGKKLPAEIIAQYANTIAYQLFCNITQRVKHKNIS